MTLEESKTVEHWTSSSLRILHPQIITTSFTPINIRKSNTNMSTTISSAPNSGVAGPAAVTTIASERPTLEKWTTGKPSFKNFFYDEPVPSYKLEKDNAAHIFPPDRLSLSDAWVVQVVKLDLKTPERYKKWPGVFSSKSFDPLLSWSSKAHV